MKHDHSDPNHPDIMVSEAAAIILIAAGEAHDIQTMRVALAAASALACWRDVVDVMAIHGAEALKHMRDAHGYNEIHVGPWHFRTEEVGEDTVWTYRLSQKDIDLIISGTTAVEPRMSPTEDMLRADLNTIARTIIAAANGGTEQDILSFWDAPEARSMNQVARLAACVGLITAAPDDDDEL